MGDSTTEPDGTSPWTRPRFVIAAVVVALIAVFAVVLAVTRPDAGGSAAAPPSVVPSSPAVTPSMPISDASVCGLEPGSQEIPVIAPADTQWELVGTMATPTAPDTIGPGLVVDGLRTCFTRSPLGALYASVNVLATTTAPGQGEALVRMLAAEGDGRDAALAAVAQEPGTGSSTRFQLAGYNFLNYDEDSSVIDLAIRADSGGYAHLPLTMRWEDGDWKVVFPPDGDLASGVQQLPDLTGYAPWGGA